MLFPFLVFTKSQVLHLRVVGHVTHCCKSGKLLQSQALKGWWDTSVVLFLNRMPFYSSLQVSTTNRTFLVHFAGDRERNQRPKGWSWEKLRRGSAQTHDFDSTEGGHHAWTRCKWWESSVTPYCRGIQEHNPRETEGEGDKTHEKLCCAALSGIRPIFF